MLSDAPGRAVSATAAEAPSRRAWQPLLWPQSEPHRSRQLLPWMQMPRAARAAAARVSSYVGQAGSDSDSDGEYDPSAQTKKRGRKKRAAKEVKKRRALATTPRPAPGAAGGERAAGGEDQSSSGEEEDDDELNTVKLWMLERVGGILDRLRGDEPLPVDDVQAL
eukprot:COSAG04_NODE_1669_length_5995_cov_2.071235_5_plen_165_part_00